MNRVYVIILNWNGWQDTIECLESVFHSDYQDYRVIVCDNSSEDSSIERIKDWADGRLNADVPEMNPLRNLSYPHIPKPIHYLEIDREQAEQGYPAEGRGARLILIRTGENLGYAGGNNVGLRYALARGDFEYVWLLNNDTVVRPDALSRMISRMAEKPDAGMCGATVVSYHDPDRIRMLGGGLYNKWIGGRRSRQFSLKDRDLECIDVHAEEERMAFVYGACLLASRPFLQDIGLISEDYFLYFEELDWAMRLRPRYTLAYAPHSIVYHKEGASINGCSGKSKSLLSDYYFIRNRLVFTRKFFPYALPTVYLGLLVSLFRRILRRQWSSARLVFGIMCGQRSPERFRGR